MRKLPMEGGAVFEALIAEMGREARAEPLRRLLESCGVLGRELLGRGPDDRLAASTPFLTMLSTAVCGWLLERQMRGAPDSAFGRAKAAVATFYLGQILPQAQGLEASVLAPADGLYALDAAALAES